MGVTVLADPLAADRAADVPTDLAATTDPVAGTVRLTWQDMPPVAPASARTFDVERDAVIIGTNMPDPEFYDGPLDPGTYTYRVRTSPPQDPMIWGSGVWGRDLWGAVT
jgi:hypothetical protein